MLLQLQNWGHSWVQVGIMRVTWSTTLGVATDRRTIPMHPTAKDLG